VLADPSENSCASRRVDDMIVVRGVNVFRADRSCHADSGSRDHFQIVVDRAGPMDVMAVKIEVTESTLSDESAR